MKEAFHFDVVIVSYGNVGLPLSLCRRSIRLVVLFSMRSGVYSALISLEGDNMFIRKATKHDERNEKKPFLSK